MKTEIFKTYSDFLNRKDKSVNGVSPDFAKKHPNYMEGNNTNKGCWNCSRCSDCSYCSRCSDCSDCSDCSRCSDCSYCSGCSDCSYCSGCSDCSDCSRCSDCSDCSYCSYCSRCKNIEKGDNFICITNMYKYTCCPRIKTNGEQWVQMGCYLRLRSDWEDDFWNNDNEFPNDGSEDSNNRLKAFEFACQWLDSVAQTPTSEQEKA